MSTGGAGSSQLTFASPRDELAYHVYIGKASARGARWQRLLCGTVWSMHCFKLVILMLQLVRARARLLWMLAFAVPMLFIEYGAAAISHVRPAWSAIYHENVKVAVQLCNITTVLVSIIMSKPVSYATKSPLEVMLCLSAVQVFGQMRLATAANVYPIMAAAYMFMEVSQWLLDESGQAIIYPLGNLAIYLAFGIVLPVLLACAFEARSRHNFLIRHRQPLTKLGPFWQRVHSATVALESRLQERFNTLSPLVSAIFRIVGEDSLHFRYAQAACADPKLAGYHGYPVKPGQQLSWQRGQQAQHAAQQPAKPMPMPAPVAPVQQPGQTQQQRRKVRFEPSTVPAETQAPAPSVDQRETSPAPAATPAKVAAAAATELVATGRKCGASPSCNVHAAASGQRTRFFIRRSISSHVLQPLAAADLRTRREPEQGPIQSAPEASRALRAEQHAGPAKPRMQRQRSRSAELLSTNVHIGMPVQLWRVEGASSADGVWHVQHSMGSHQSMHSMLQAARRAPTKTGAPQAAVCHATRAERRQQEPKGSFPAAASCANSAANLARPPQHQSRAWWPAVGSTDMWPAPIEGVSLHPIQGLRAAPCQSPTTAHAQRAGMSTAASTPADPSDREWSLGSAQHSTAWGSMHAAHWVDASSLAQPDDTVRYNTILAGIGSCLFMIVLLALTEKYAPEEYNRLWVAVSSFFFFD